MTFLCIGNYVRAHRFANRQKQYIKNKKELYSQKNHYTDYDNQNHSYKSSSTSNSVTSSTISANNSPSIRHPQPIIANSSSTTYYGNGGGKSEKVLFGRDDLMNFTADEYNCMKGGDNRKNERLIDV